MTRWFGSVLLGSGGLVRAYGGTAALCLRGAEKTVLIEAASAMITCAFGDLARVQARLGDRPGVQVLDQAFTNTGAVLSVSVPKAEADLVSQLVRDVTSGRAVIRWNE